MPWDHLPGGAADREKSDWWRRRQYHEGKLPVPFAYHLPDMRLVGLILMLLVALAAVPDRCGGLRAETALSSPVAAVGLLNAGAPCCPEGQVACRCVPGLPGVVAVVERGQHSSSLIPPARATQRWREGRGERRAAICWEAPFRPPRQVLLRNAALLL